MALRRTAMGTIGVVVGTLAAAVLQMPSAHGEEPNPPEAPGMIELAAEGYVLGNADAAADLANAAAPDGSVELAGAPGEAVAVAETVSGAVVGVDAKGVATLRSQGTADLRIGFEGDPESIEIVDGVVVQSEVAASTDGVIRATESGVQMIAILANSEASNEILFPLALPEGARLVEQVDGSITVIADVVVRPPAAEGSEAGPPETRQAEVATIAVPWAVDASGDQLPTRFEVADRGILQIVDVDAETLFPVVVDPQIGPGGATGCTQYSGRGTMGCFWEYRDHSGANFSIPWTTPADLDSSKATVVCSYGDLNTAPARWGNRISSMSNWTKYTHTYYTGKNKSGASRAVAKGASVTALTSSLDNEFESLYMTCAY